MKLATTILVFCVGALLALGMIMLYSSSMMQDGARYLLMQLLWCGLGLAGCVVAASLDYRHLKKISWLLFIAAIVLLILVLIPRIGSKINGAHRWLVFGGGFRLQPSEFAKMALLVLLAHYGEHNLRQMPTFLRGLIYPGLLVVAVLGLIFFEPDVGTTLLLGLVSALVLLIAGLRWRYFLPPLVLVTVAVGLFLWHDPMRSDRIYSWLHLEETRLEKGHQAYQAMLALGSGGPTGLGLGNGRQKLGFVPEHHTDFIFSIIGEELGLIATLAVVVMFVLLVVCGMFISSRACDTFGLLLGSGITFLIGLQAFINMAVVTGVLPNKGLSLPFISYGGSNLLVMLFGVGVLMSIARHAREPLIRPENPFAETPLPQAS